MKISQAALILVAAVPASAITEVHIDVKCKGAKFNKLSVSATTEVSHALEDSFNEVHSAMDNDDSELTNVHWGSYGTATLSEDMVGQNGGGWDGDYGCGNFCSDDDDAMLGVDSTAGHKQWEAKLVETLAATGRSTFQNLKSCSIKMRPRDRAVDEAATQVEVMDLQESVSESSLSKVRIQARCSGVNFDRLSVGAVEFAGKALQDAYNKVHGDSDSELSNVHFRGDASLFQNLGQSGGGWDGDYGCNLCPDDDDAMLSAASGNTLKAWEREFAAGLKGKKAFKNVGKCDIKMRPSPEIVDEPNVDIQVKCKGGPNFNDLTIAQVTFVSHALESTYNKVHGAKENDDSDLSNVHYHAARYFDEHQLGQNGGGWDGDYGCGNFCPDDDDAAMLALGSRGAALTAWEDELVAALVESENVEFHKVHSCDISITPHRASTLAAQASDQTTPEFDLFAEAMEESSDTPVHISVKCKGINFRKLSVADDTAIGNILQDSYNEVHSKAENDDSQLSNVHYHATRDFDEHQLGQAGGGWDGDYGCGNFCPDDDDMLMGVTGSNNLKMWEEQFVLGLVQSGRKSFAKVGQCSIHMAARRFVADEEEKTLTVGESTKCGLRACADE